MLRLNTTTYHLLPIFLGMLLGVFALSYYQKNYAFHNLNELALGTENDSDFATINGVPIHCVDLSDAQECLNGYANSALNGLIVWFGNSQIHAINQKSPEDKTAVPAIHHALMKQGKYFLAFSQSNGNLQEHYLLLEYLMTQTSIDTIVLPLVFDDMRELGIRDSILKILKEPGIENAISKTTFGSTLLTNNRGLDTQSNDLAGLKGSVQNTVESDLNRLLESQSTLWENRAAIRGHLLKHLYRFRNWALGIKTTSVRKKIPARYQKNMAAFEAILATTFANHIQVLAYISPLRNDVKIPYKRSEYELFKQELASITHQNRGVTLLDLESLVPAALWGERGSGQIDFMHFQAGGHKLLAEALSEKLIELNSAMVGK